MKINKEPKPVRNERYGRRSQAIEAAIGCGGDD